MTRKSKAVFKMAGYTYPGTSPMTDTIKKKEFDVDALHEEETREMEEYVVPEPDNKLTASIDAHIKNALRGRKPKVKK
jgi:hypothetical protein